MDEKILQIAKIAHETNRAYCATIGDNSQPAWDDAPEWQRESAIKGVKLHLLAHGEGVDLGPSSSHDAWLAEKRGAGWKYGPVKDADKKEHPCFVPYEVLPAEQQLKDYLFAGVVKAFWDCGAAQL